jgi:hypothetical protein
MKISDKVRSMTDEELGDYLGKLVFRALNDPVYTPCEKMQQAFREVVKTDYEGE